MLSLLGSMVQPAREAAHHLADVKVVNVGFIKPLDKQLIMDAVKGSEKIITVEEGVLDGGFGTAIMELLNEENIRIPVKRLGLPSKFIEHGKREEILAAYGLSAEGIGKIINEN